MHYKHEFAGVTSEMRLYVHQWAAQPENVGC